MARLGRKLGTDEALLLLSLGGQDGRDLFVVSVGMGWEAGDPVVEDDAEAAEKCAEGIKNGRYEGYLLERLDE